MKISQAITTLQAFKETHGDIRLSEMMDDITFEIGTECHAEGDETVVEIDRIDRLRCAVCGKFCDDEVISRGAIEEGEAVCSETCYEEYAAREGEG